MSILVFGPDNLKAVARVREFAEDPDNWRRIRDDQVIMVPGEIEAYTLEFPVGFKVVYSIDEAGEQTARHLSVSLFGTDGEPKGIAEPVMREFMVLYEFGDDASVGIIPGDPPWVVHAIEAFTSRTG